MRAVFGIRKPLKIAVMGCVVNGPGEARDCDVGIAGGKGKCVLFRRGEPVGTVARGGGGSGLPASRPRLSGRGRGARRPPT